MNPFWRRKNVFVTGATGLLGSHLTRELLEHQAQVVALVRDSVPQSLFFSKEPGWDLSQRVITVRGDVEDYRLLERVLNEYEIDTVFHLAAQTLVETANRSPLGTFKTNIEGTWNLLEAVRHHSGRVKRVVVASSDKAYGNLAGEAYDEGFPLRGEHPYDVSKSCADLISRSFAVSYRLPIAITRCGNFFGPGDLNFSRIVPGTIRSVLEGEPPIIRSDGTYIRDYIFVEDGVGAYLALAEAVERLPPGEAFNFSYGLRLTVLEVTEKILSLMASPLKPVVQGRTTNEIPVQCLESAKARRELGWTPQFGFEEGLRRTIAWYERFPGLHRPAPHEMR